MTITAKVLLDSISPSGARLVTFECTYPRFIHSEFMTHRMLSRNAASSRAIPAAKLIERITKEPALPVYWGRNQAGMQAAEELPNTEDTRRRIDVGPAMVVDVTPMEYVRGRWLEARDMMLRVAEELSDLGSVHPDWAGIGLHKQIANRILEPWMHITVITSGTDWANFFHLRTHKAAQPEFQVLAKEMKSVYASSQPTRLSSWDWHMPLIHEEDWEHAGRLAAAMTPEQLRTETTVEYPLTPLDWTKHILRKVSVGRCARVSYLTHDGVRDLSKDVELHDKLLAGIATEEPLHMSPFEHVARALDDLTRSGNFIGFDQYRKLIQGEAGPPEPRW